MGYDITKLTDNITTLKSLADDLSSYITSNESYIEDPGVNGIFHLAIDIEESIDRSTVELRIARDKLKYKYGFGGGPTGPYPTGTYK